MLSQYLKNRDNSQILTYTGALNEMLISSIMQIVDARLVMDGLSKKPKKNLINILIECLQNIFYHADHPNLEKHHRECVFILGEEGQFYYIHVGNFAFEKDANKLKEKLDKIKPMNAEELHHYYLDVLDKGEISPKGGAGLGMIRVFRESKQMVDYSFEHIEKDLYFFNMKIKIQKD